MKRSILLISLISCSFGVFAQPIAGVTNVCAGSLTTLSDATPGGTWASSTPSVATVGSASGDVTGVSAGTAVITYNFPAGGSVVATVTVNPLPAAISGPGNVCQGANTSFTDVTAGGAWSSSNNFVAMVDGTTGIATGISEDTTSITYTLATGCSVSTGITVNAMPLPIIGSTTFCVGVPDSLYESGGGTWSTSSPGIVSIGSLAGNITGLAAGTANVTYTLSTGCAAYLAVTVNPMPDAGTIAAPGSVCIAGNATCTDIACCGVWTSSNPSVATVGSVSGVVTGVSAGIVTINYAVTNSCGMVNAVKAFQVLSDVACNQLSVGKTDNILTTLSVSPNPANDGNIVVILTSANDEQATIVITNVTGEKVKEISTVTNKKNAIKIDSAAGIYYISATTAHGKYDGKVVVE